MLIKLEKNAKDQTQKSNIFKCCVHYQHLMLFREINVVYSDNHIKHINTLHGKSAGLFNVKPGGI